jgi:hypothetical protein
MAVVLVAALDAAAIRTLLSPNRIVELTATTTADLVVFACGVLPMASLLVVGALAQAPSICRPGGGSCAVVGFQVFGWAAVSLFIVLSVLVPAAVAGYGEALAAFLYPAIAASPRGWPDWALMVFELAFCAAVFTLPELLMASVGALLANRYWITVRIERRRRQGAQAELVTDVQESAHTAMLLR